MCCCNSKERDCSSLPDQEDAFRLIRELSIGPTRDAGLLDAAIVRPRSSAYGVDAYSTVELNAASLFHPLAINQPLVDGNKRLAWLATVVFFNQQLRIRSHRRPRVSTGLGYRE